MKHTDQSLFLERNILFFAGPERPSSAPVSENKPEVKQPREVGKEFEYDSWKEFKDWVGKGNPNDLTLSIFDMLHDKDITFVLPDGTEYRPIPTGTYISGGKDEAQYYEPDLTWPNGYTLSYESGLSGPDGKPVEAKIRSVKIYPSSKEFPRQTAEWLKSAPIGRLKAEATVLRDRINTRLSFFETGNKTADGLMEVHGAVRGLLEQGKLEEATKIVENLSSYLSNASREQRQRESLPASGIPQSQIDFERFLHTIDGQPTGSYHYDNPYELQYSHIRLRNDDGTPNEDGIATVLSAIDDDIAAIGRDYKRQELDAQAIFRRYQLLHEELVARGDLTDGAPEWFEATKARLERT